MWRKTNGNLLYAQYMIEINDRSEKREKTYIVWKWFKYIYISDTVDAFDNIY